MQPAVEVGTCLPPDRSAGQFACLHMGDSFRFRHHHGAEYGPRVLLLCASHPSVPCGIGCAAGIGCKQHRCGGALARRQILNALLCQIMPKEGPACMEVLTSCGHLKTENVALLHVWHLVVLASNCILGLQAHLGHPCRIAGPAGSCAGPAGAAAPGASRCPGFRKSAACLSAPCPPAAVGSAGSC